LLAALPSVRRVSIRVALLATAVVCVSLFVAGSLRYEYFATLGNVRDILINNRDRAAVATPADWISPSHAHVRGPGYYQ